MNDFDKVDLDEVVNAPRAHHLSRVVVAQTEQEAREVLAQFGLDPNEPVDWLAEAKETLELAGEDGLACQPGALAALALAYGGDVSRQQVAAAIGRPIEGALELAAREIALWRGLLPYSEAILLARQLGWRDDIIVRQAAPKAERLLTFVLARDPTNFDALSRMNTLLRGLSRSAEADALVARAITLMSGDVHANVQNAKSLRRLRFLYQWMGDVDGEIEQLKRILELEPGATDCERQLTDLLTVESRNHARDLMSAGRFEEATDLHRQLGATMSDSPEFRQLASAFMHHVMRPIGKPLKIVGAVDRYALGDATMALVWLASAKLHLTNGLLTVVTAPLTDGMEAALRCCPYVNEHIVVAPTEIPVVCSELANQPRTQVLNPRQIPHLNLEFCKIRARFVIPEAGQTELHDKLMECGLAPDRWLVSMHCRSDVTFRGRTTESFVRDVHPQTFSELADYIVDELGGQIAWLGHPGMPDAPSRLGIVPLSSAPVLLQNYAIARSRYFVGCDSGPVMTASAFEVPTLKSNSIYESGGWNPHDIVLMKNILTADGTVLSFSGIPSRVHWLRSLHEFRDFIILDNTFEQLKHCVDILHNRTSSVGGWRELRSKCVVEHPPGAFPMTSPARIAPCAQLIDLSHLMRRPILKASEFLDL